MIFAELITTLAAAAGAMCTGIPLTAAETGRSQLIGADQGSY